MKGNDPNLDSVGSWKTCENLLNKLDRKRRDDPNNSRKVALDDCAKELPIVSSLYPDLRKVIHQKFEKQMDI